MPMSWRRAATSRSRRSPRPQPVLGAQVVEEADGEGGHVPRVRGVVAVLLAERGGGGQHRARQVLDAVPLVGADHVQEQARAQRGLGHEEARGLGLEEQLAVDEERGDEALDLGEGQAVGLRELLVVQGRRLLAEREGSARGGPRGWRRRLAPRPRPGRRRSARARRGRGNGAPRVAASPGGCPRRCSGPSAGRASPAARGCRATRRGSASSGSPRGRRCPSRRARPSGGTRGRRCPAHLHEQRVAAPRASWSRSASRTAR
jgi:hypothetical protein